MGERKVLNKYYPPDFDPAKLPRGQRGNKDAQMKVRMMLAMSVRCSTCGNYMYKGTKFNMRMEDVVGEDYLGIKIFRFYFHCKNCGAEITMKTDPKNSDYAMEQGATRNYEPWREKEKTVAEAVSAREEEERGNAMKALENRTLDSKKEMDIMDALEELVAVKGQHNKVSAEDAIAAIKRGLETDQASLDAEDEEMVRQMFSQRTSQVKRLDESAANAALLDGGGGSASGGAASLNEQWDGGAGALAAAEAAEKKPARSLPEQKPSMAPRLAVRPKFAVKPKAAATAAADRGQNGAAAPGGAAGSGSGGSGGGSGGGSTAQQAAKRPAEDQSGSAAEPAAKRPAVAAAGSGDGSPAASDGDGGGGLPGLLGDYGSDESDEQ